jgi:hypothetical protein
MSSRWLPECYCFYEHPLSKCGAKTKAERGGCKYFTPNCSGDDCSHFGDDLKHCDNHYANFEAYAAQHKDKIN